MLAQSDLDASIVTSYRETEYQVTEGKPFVLRIGEPCPDLLGLYKARNVSCAAFITACNPFSQELSDAENTRRQAELAAELSLGGIGYLQGLGQHPSEKWPGEPSFLALGLALEAAKSLGKAHEQNAIIWCGADAVPSLILLR